MMIRAMALAGMAAALPLAAQPAAGAAPRANTVADAVQVLADLTAIDADCHGLAVDFGIGFRYAADQGVSPATILPAGSRRPAFETALRTTLSGYGDAVVCGALAHHYSVALPGSVTFPLSARDGS